MGRVGMRGKGKFMYLSSGLRSVNFSDFVPVLSKILYMAFDESVNYSVQ